MKFIITIVAFVTLFVFLFMASSPCHASSGEVRGEVRDAMTARPLADVEVKLLAQNEKIVASMMTDQEGRFRIGDVEAGRYSLIFLRETYETLRVTQVRPRGAAESGLVVRLIKWVTVADTVVVTASRRSEPALRVPVAVSTIPRIELREQLQVTPVDLARDVTGVDFASKGIMQHTYSVRGTRGVTSATMLVLADNRFTAMPFLSYNIPYSMSYTSDDIDRIEIVRGPGSAVYGPNTSQGVLHVITRSPFESEGTSLSVMGGERDMLQGTFRHARILNEKLAFKISGQILTARDWEYADPKEVEKREKEILAGADQDTLKIGKRDFDIKNERGDLRLDWRVGENTTVEFHSGMARTASTIDLISTTGAIQIDDYWNAYAQSRFRYGRFMANLMYNLQDTGNTFFLRTGEPVIDKSRLFAAQLQYSSNLLDLTTLLCGADIRRTEPRTEGTVNGRFEDNDTMSEFGGYFNSTTTLLGNLDLVAALRIDYHDRLNDLAISPRVGFVYEPYESHAVRLTYNRAYDSPSARDIFIDIKLGELPWMDLRLVSTPKGGFNFSRSCSGQYTMRSSFHPEGAEALLCADATLMWPVIQQMVPALASIPAPNGSQVGTDLRSLNWITQNFSDPIDTINNLDQRERNYITTIETGYKGSLGRSASIAADLYWTEIDNFAIGLYGATPNVFFRQADLQAYLENTGGLSPAEAAAYAEQIARLPVGTVAPDGIESADIILSYRQEGSYIENRWGFDLHAEVALFRGLSARGSYSWIDEKIISVPKNKGSLALLYRDLRNGIDGGIKFRAVEQFAFASGVYHGTVEPYSVFDIYAGYRLPVTRDVRISLNAYNVFDNRHQEVFGAPELGRLVVTRVQYNF